LCWARHDKTDAYRTPDFVLPHKGQVIIDCDSNLYTGIVRV